MDQQYIKSIVDIVENSDLNLFSIEMRFARYDDDTSPYSTITMFCEEKFGNMTRLSNSDVASNILIFTVFDGFVEDKYSLTEGNSFKKHYEALPDNTDIELIQKDCYRILKLMRNAMQHNLSGVEIEQSIYCFGYRHKNTDFKLEISKRSVELLYTIVLALIKNGMVGLETQGHYEAVLKEFYKMMLSGISIIEDEFGNELNSNISPELQDFKISVRYPLSNPRLYEETEQEIILRFYDPGCPQYATDYMYSVNGTTYLLPEEMGEIRMFSENKEENSEPTQIKCIAFKKSLLTNRWERKEND